MTAQPHHDDVLNNGRFDQDSRGDIRDRADGDDGQRIIDGESGSGKSVMARSIMRLVMPPGKIENGSQIILNTPENNPVDIAELPFISEQLREIRGGKISMIFQEPMTSLSPVHKVGFQIAEAALLHVTRDKKEAREIALDRLVRVGIPNPERIIEAYPHELSGGLRQRVMIAMAVSCRPYVLIADEPTTALDVTIQWQILRLMNELREEFGMSILNITHDLGVVAQTADVVAVMYLGQIVETADVITIFERPQHPYTRALLLSIPKPNPRSRTDEVFLSGETPSPVTPPSGCYFHPRCKYAAEKCVQETPPLRSVGETRQVACHFAETLELRGVPSE